MHVHCQQPQESKVAQANAGAGRRRRAAARYLVHPAQDLVLERGEQRGVPRQRGEQAVEDRRARREAQRVGDAHPGAELLLNLLVLHLGVAWRVRLRWGGGRGRGCTFNDDRPRNTCRGGGLERQAYGRGKRRGKGKRGKGERGCLAEERGGRE
jgi:hypothetical protein